MTTNEIRALVIGLLELYQLYRPQFADVSHAVDFVVQYKSNVWLNYRTIDWNQHPIHQLCS